MILIDDRAGSRDLIRHHPLDNSDIATLARLDSADVYIAGNGPNGRTIDVGVEVKSVSDLLSSANTGRLQATQATRMLEEYDAPWLLVYGEYRCGPGGVLQVRRKGTWDRYRIGKREVPWIYLEGILLTLDETGFAVKHTVDISEAALWIGALHRWWSKDWSDHKLMRTFDRSREIAGPDLTTEERTLARMISSIPGIGFERGVSAAHHFGGSVPSMFGAPVSEWANVPGIGKVLAQTIYNTLHKGKRSVA